MNRHIRFIALILLLPTLVACGTSIPAPSDAEAISATLNRLALERGNVVNSVPNFRISGWHQINVRNLIVTAGLHDHYLLSLNFPCQNLPFAFGIRLDTLTNTLSRGDYVVIDTVHSPTERCQIQEITQLTDRDTSG